MKKVFNWLIDKWLAGFITGCIFFFAKLYVDLPDESKVNFFGFKWFREILQTQVSVCTLIFVVIALIALSRLDKYYYKLKSEKEKNIKPIVPVNSFEHYKKDRFGLDRSIWTWDYSWNKWDQFFMIINTRPSCPACGTPMEGNTLDNPSILECHKCRLDGSNYQRKVNERSDDIEKEIIRRIQNNEVKA